MVVAPGFRTALTGIIFLLKSGIPWEMLLLELGCSSGVTCRRRLRDWQEAGVWDRLHRELLDRGGEADQIDWSRASLASARIPANGGGGLTGPNPTDRCKPGAKRHSVVERGGHALATLVTAANRHDSVVFAELLDAILPITRANGRRKRPGKLHADKGYDIPRCGAAISGSVSPTRASTPAHGSAGIAGWSNARWPGSTGFGGRRSGLNAGVIFTKHSSLSPVIPSASIPSKTGLKGAAKSVCKARHPPVAAIPLLL